MSADSKPPGMSWEDFAELKIREAQEAGDFSEIAGFGAPIASLDEPYDDQWWIREKLKRERLSVLPPSLEIKRHVSDTLHRLGDLALESDVRREIRQLNERIRDANYRSVWGPASSQMPIDEEEAVRKWRSIRRQGA
jgi:hypothetical protein